MTSLRTVLLAASLLAASTAVTAAPYAITYESEITNASIPGIANETYSLTFIFDNGGTSTASQTWQPAHLTCAIWRMNDARNVFFQQNLSIAPPNLNTGATTTNASGALTGLFTLRMDSPAVQPGQYVSLGASFNGAIKWYADNGAGNATVMVDGIGTGTNRSFDDPSGSFGGVQMTPARWSNPQRVMGPCDDTPYVPALFAVTVPAPFWGGFGNQQVLVTSWTQAHAWHNVSISAPLKDTRPGGPHADVQGTVYLVTQVGPGTAAAHNAAPPFSVSGLTDTFANTPLWTNLTLPAGTYYLLFVSATNDPMSLSPAIPFGIDPPTYTTGIGVTALLNVPELNDPAQLNTTFPPASPFTPAGNYPSHLLVNITGNRGALPAPAFVPALDRIGLALMALLLGAFGWFVWRRA